MTCRCRRSQVLMHSDNTSWHVEVKTVFKTHYQVLRQEAKTPIIVDSRLEFLEDPIVFISVRARKGDQKVCICCYFLTFRFSPRVVADTHPLPLPSQLDLCFSVMHRQRICHACIVCSIFACEIMFIGITWYNHPMTTSVVIEVRSSWIMIITKYHQ